MRAILCVRPNAAPSRTPGELPWSPAVLATCAAITPRTTVGSDQALYCELRSPGPWPRGVALARELLARLQAGAPGVPALGGIGLAAGAFPAACAAATAAPGTLRVLAPGTEAAALAPLPADLLPGLSAAHRSALGELRVFTLGDLAALPPAVLVGVFGARARRWPALARGEDPRAVGNEAPASTVASALLLPLRVTQGQGCGAGPALAVRRALAPEVARRLLGPPDLASLSGELAATLATAGRAAHQLAVTVGFADGTQAMRTVRLPTPVTSAASLHAAAWPVMASLLRARRRRPAWLALAAPQTTQAATQLALPLPPAPAERDARLAAALADIHARYGAQAIDYGLRRHSVLAYEFRPSA